MIRAVCLLLDGRTSELERELKLQMQQAAENYAFEEAARVRDQLQAVIRLNEQQKAVTSGGDLDIVGLAKDSTGTCLQIFFVRGGKLIGRDNFFLQNDDDSDQEILTAFIKQYYNEASFVPREILLPVLLRSDGNRSRTDGQCSLPLRDAPQILPEPYQSRSMFRLLPEAFPLRGG